MADAIDPVTNRRQFLKFLAASPLMASAGITGGLVDELIASGPGGAPDLELFMNEFGKQEIAIASDSEALNVFDFQVVAKQVLPPAHYGYMATSIDDDSMLRINREGFDQYGLRMRRLVDIRSIDPSIDLFGKHWSTPITIQPTSSNAAFHPGAEIAVAKAARNKNHIQMLSTVASSAIEDVTAARGEPIWYQLYADSYWNRTLAMVKRAEATGTPVLVWTIDLLGGRNTETATRLARIDDRNCSVCHEPTATSRYSRTVKPMGQNLPEPIGDSLSRRLTWDFIARLKDATPMKLILKGVVTREDALLAVSYGADGIIVSNHGARAAASGRSTIECLPEVVNAVDGRIPVLIDSGFRRGTDIFKALALGATAVGIGRPYLWGLASFGQAGVEAVLQMLRSELELVMRQAGTPTIKDIRTTHIIHRAI